MARGSEFVRAGARAKVLRAQSPIALSARYDARGGKVVVEFKGGLGIVFPPSAAQGLEDASAADLKVIEISPSGLGLHFPRLDADIYIPALLEGCFGSRKWAAERLGSSGGSAKSAAKSEASRRNGKMGGRPRKAVAG